MTALQILNDFSIDFKLTEFYKHNRRHHPLSLSDLYGVRFSNESAQNIFLPWIHSLPVKTYLDDAFFGGKQDLYVLNKVDKLKRIIKSILDNGYFPEKFQDRKNGYITVHKLVKNGTYRLYTISGNHRVAALSALCPKNKFPCIFDSMKVMKPRDKENNGSIGQSEFDVEAVKLWPSVNSGFLSKQKAIDIFNAFFDT